MKKISILFFITLLFSAVASFGQSAAKKPAAPSGSCFTEWYTMLRERGAKAAPNGTHEVVVTIRGEVSEQCLMGKVTVQNGKIVPPVLIQKQDGSYEEASSLGKKMDPSWLAANKETMFDVVDGMSGNFYTTDKDVVRIFFYTLVNEKVKANKVAPSPSALIKD